MIKVEDIVERYPDEEILIADGYDDAIIGLEEGTLRVIYSISKCIEITQGDDMSYEEASEYFYYNTVGAYVGEQTPIWCDDEF